MFIVVGDCISSGGCVIIGLFFIDIEGKFFVCINDYVICFVYGGVFLIVFGDIIFIIDGQLVVCEGDCLVCGCSLIVGQQFLVYVDDGFVVIIVVVKVLVVFNVFVCLQQIIFICECCLWSVGEWGMVFLLCVV